MQREKQDIDEVKNELLGYLKEYFIEEAETNESNSQD